MLTGVKTSFSCLGGDPNVTEEDIVYSQTPCAFLVSTFLILIEFVLSIVPSLSSGKVAHPKISPIAIFAFYSLNYSLVARLQDNSRPKSPTKIETKRKLPQFTVSGWLIINGGESGSEQIN